MVVQNIDIQEKFINIGNIEKFEIMNLDSVASQTTSHNFMAQIDNRLNDQVYFTICIFKSILLILSI